MKFCHPVPVAILVFSLGGCQATPMTYAQWKKEQDDKLASARAGQIYKTPTEVRTEAAAMKKAVEEIVFKKN